MKKSFLLCVFLLVFSTHALAQDAPKPYTAIRGTSISFSTGNSIAGATRTFAVSSDGRRVEIRRIEDRETGDAIELRTVSGGRDRWTIEPKTRTIAHSREIYPKRAGLDLLMGLTPEAEMAAIVACDSDAEPSEKMLGYPVHQVRSIRPVGNPTSRRMYPNGVGRISRIEITMWVAPALGCLPLRMEQVTVATDGKQMGRTIQTVEQVIEGEPDARWFEVPADYQVIRYDQVPRTWRAPGFRP